MLKILTIIFSCLVVLGPRSLLAAPWEIGAYEFNGSAPITRALTVQSQNPGSGVAITATTDNHGAGNGVTQFSRTYNNNTSVTLVTASTAFNGNTFQGWTGCDAPNSTTCNMTMSADKTVTAVYVTSGGGQTWTFCANEGEVCSFTGTQLVRYGANTSFNTLTATTSINCNNATFGDPAFGIAKHCDYSNTSGTPVTWTLTIASSTPDSGAAITVSPNDNNSAGNGSTQFTRVYNDTTAVTLTAPSTAGGNNFSNWTGCNIATTVTCNVTMSSNKTVTAVYTAPTVVTRTLTVASSNPNSSVVITVSPNDNNSAGNGTTQFTRVYDNNTAVTLTAVSIAGGNNFSSWSGCDTALGATCNITISADRTVTAIYVTPANNYVVSYTSTNPSSGDSIGGVGQTPTNKSTPAQTSYTAIANATSTGPVLWYKLDDGSGAPVDSSGNGLTAALTGGTWTTGTHSGGLSFNGSTDVAIIPDTPFTQFATNQFTIAMNVKPNATLNTSNIIGLYSKDDSSISIYANLVTGYCSTPGIAIFYKDGDVLQDVFLCASQVLITGSFTHLMFVKDATTLKIKINNSEVASLNTTATLGRNPAVVRLANTRFNEGCNCILDDVVIFDRALSSGEQTDLYNNTITKGNNFGSWSLGTCPGSASGKTATIGPVVADCTATANYLPHRIVSIASTNPASAVSVSCTTDRDGNGNGSSPFTRDYDDATVVTCTAPSTVAGNSLGNWSGCDSVNGLNCVLTVTAARTITANYVLPSWSINITSSNPASGVAMTGVTTDLNSNGNGNTSLVRVYQQGTVFAATAPATAGGNNFDHLDGCDNTSGTGNRTCNITSVIQDRTVTAVYVTPVQATRTLTVASTNPASGAAITVSPNDNNSAGNGSTQFTRVYNDTTAVTLTAPSTAGGNNFSNWSGCDSTTTTIVTGDTCHLTMDSDKTANAVYTPATPATCSATFTVGAGGLTLGAGSKLTVACPQ